MGVDTEGKIYWMLLIPTVLAAFFLLIALPNSLLNADRQTQELESVIYNERIIRTFAYEDTYGIIDKDSVTEEALKSSIESDPHDEPAIMVKYHKEKHFLNRLKYNDAAPLANFRYHSYNNSFYILSAEESGLKADNILIHQLIKKDK